MAPAPRRGLARAAARRPRRRLRQSPPRKFGLTRIGFGDISSRPRTRRPAVTLRAQEGLESFGETGARTCPTFPHDHDPPAEGFECTDGGGVSRDVGCELRSPEFPPCLRRRRSATPGMPMPEATVDEDDGAVPSQHEVRRARQASIVKAEPVAGPVEKAANHELRTGVPAANPPHEPAAHRVDAGVDGGRGTGRIDRIRRHSTRPRRRRNLREGRTAGSCRGAC